MAGYGRRSAIFTESFHMSSLVCGVIYIVFGLHFDECYPCLVQESALAIAKVVLAKEFEKATLQDIRALMMEGSSMRIFLRGEVFELQPKKIGVLLDGFVRPESSFAIITAPAGLMRKVPLPSSGGKCAFPFLVNIM